MTKFRDSQGNTVELQRLDGVEVLVPRSPHGHVLGCFLGAGVESHCTSPAELAERGIDLATLEQIS